MSNYIYGLYNYLSKLLGKKKKSTRRAPESTYCTPLPASSRFRLDNFRNADLRSRKQFSYPDDLSRPTGIPRKTPLVRSSSQISVKSCAQTNVKTAEALRKKQELQRLNINSLGNDDFEARRQFSKSDDLSTRVPRPFPFNRSSSHTSLDQFDHDESLTLGKERYPRNPETRNRNGMNKSARGPIVTSSSTSHNPPIPDLFQIPIRGSQSSFDFNSNDANPLDTLADDPEEHCVCNKPLHGKRQSHLKTVPFSHPGFPLKSNEGIRSKIPVHNFGRSQRNKSMPSYYNPQRGRYTLAEGRLNSVEYFEREDMADNMGISNVTAYHNDTNNKFDRVFKLICKKKIRNLIDSSSHSRWMQLAGITVDIHASMFKQFAGGKVVLTIGEYKFLIDKICTVHDMDYWDVLRRMATFHDRGVTAL